MFAYLAVDIRSHLHPFCGLLKQNEYCLIGPSKVKGKAIDLDKSFYEQHIFPEMFLNVIKKESISLNISCAYFADDIPLQITACTSWTISQVKSAFFNEIKMGLYFYKNIDKRDVQQMNEDNFQVYAKLDCPCRKRTT